MGRYRCIIRSILPRLLISKTTVLFLSALILSRIFRSLVFPFSGRSRSREEIARGLSLEPLMGAISAGNAIVLKPLELAPSSSIFLANTIPKYLDSKSIKVVQGVPHIGERLLDQKWDKIFFTGSTRVGRMVMTAAAKHLTPVALELGGKCPAIVDSLTSSRDRKFIPADAVNGAPSSNSEGSMDPSFYRALKENDDRSAMSIMSGLETSFTGLTAGKNTVLHLAAALGHYSIIDLAQEAYDMVFAVNSKGDTPLHCAARGGHTEVVGYLIFSMRQSAPGVSLKTLQNERGNTPLHEAVGSNHMRAAAELMRADAGFGETVNRSGVSALYMAVEREDMGIVRMLLAFPDCSAGGPNGQTALHAAASRNLEITQLLLQERPGISRQVDANGSSPLHYAASIGDLGIINLLISHDATTAHLLDKDGLSPIHAAAAMGNTNAIDVLLKFCPDAFELTDIKGRNFLHVAILNKRSNVVKYALRNPDINDLFNESDSDGNTPLHLAVTRSNLEMVNLLLADKRTDTRAANHEGLTPLDLAYSLTGSSIHLRMHKIMDKLVSAGSQFGPQRIDLMTSKYQQKDEEQMNRCRSLANNLAIVSVLITTVTFAAAFTLPGGYANEHGPNQGMAILSKNAAFQAFIISDTVAMVSSITVTCLLIYTVSFDHDVRVHSLSTAMKLFWVALGAMVVAFGTGTYVVLAPNCQWLAILVCSIACSVPLIAWMIASWPAFDPLGFGTSKWKVTEGNGEKKSITLEVKKVVASKMPPMTIIDFSTPHYLASENI